MRPQETTIDISDRPTAAGPVAYVAVTGASGVSVVELPLGSEVSVGRDPSSAVHVNDPAVSRLHATLRWDGRHEIRVVDHGSRNGTSVDGVAVKGEVAAPSGSEIIVGPARLLLVARPQPGDAPPPGSTDDARLFACDRAMLGPLAVAERAARHDVTVLLTGETGVGKEVVARHIHAQSARAGRPFVPINCGAIPESLAESILFGHEKGAFTGADASVAGPFEVAHGGTLFLDEVGELSSASQARLLRVLAEKQVRRVGGRQVVDVDVRVIAATHRSLERCVLEGQFRQDLYYRLSVLPIELPPLRDRPEDVVPLADRFLREFSGDQEVRLASDAEHKLRGHLWPGNVRELRNVIERAVAIQTGGVVRAADLGLQGKRLSTLPPGILRDQIDEVERQAVIDALEASGGNQSQAARRLGISRRAFIYKLEKYDLKSPPRSKR